MRVSCRTWARLTGAAVLAVVAGAGPAWAQSAPTGPRVTVEAQGGWLGFADESVVNHGMLGVALPVALGRRLEVGPEVVYAVGPGSDRELVATGNVWVRLATIESADGGASFSPFLVGAYGVMRHSNRFGTRDFSSTEPTGSVGVGLRIAGNDRWYVAPEWRVGVELHMRVSVSVGIRLK